MADKFKLYVLCPSCGGTGVLTWGSSPSQPGSQTCPTCANEQGALGAKVFNGKRHIYYGRIKEIEVDDE